ncbi:hypothetical protein IFR04_012212, partial [Cadophora malorum]
MSRPYLDEFIQTMQCIQARTTVASTPATLSDVGVTYFTTACSKLASSALDNGRDMSQISLVTLLNQCQQLLSIHSTGDRPSTPKSTSTPRLTTMPTPPRTEERLIPTYTPIPPSAQKQYTPRFALKLTPIPSRSPNSLLPAIEPISTPMHFFNPRYPTAPSRSPSPSSSSSAPTPAPTSTSTPTSKSPSSSIIFEPPIHGEELSDGEDTASLLSERRARRIKKWLKRRERKRRDLEDTVRFPRFRRGSVDGNG